ncbi:MAG: BMP family ABC transporter substrate-binding protein [Alphaproteobacteria bacterium]|nr:BMP family ABC transporter substrate-binding protein [Alphaproteobacteria bacterium]
MDVTISRRGLLKLAGVSAAGAALGAPGLVVPARGADAFGPVAEEDAVIAFGHVGPISDEGWTFSHHQGLLSVKQAFPKAKYIEVQNIPYSADATRTFRQFVAQGATMVILSSEFGDLLHSVSDKAPQIAWMECNGHTVGQNRGWYYVKHWLPSYVTGVAAGLTSKTGKLGYVGSMPVPSVYGGVNAFLMGARSVNPKATMQVILINSWYDPQAAAQAGTALIDNGCDCLFGIMDEAAYLQVAEKRGVPAVMWNTDVRRYGPKSYVSSIVVDWRKYYVQQVTDRMKGMWKPGQATLLGMAEGVDRDAWGASVPENVRKAADAARDKMLRGWTPFVGEIKDTNGKVRIAKGQTMDDASLYNWSWPIDGVTGLKTV